MRLLHLLNRDSREFTNVAQATSENEVGVFGVDTDEGEIEAEETDMTTGAFHFTTEISAEAISDNCTSPLDNIHLEEPHVIGTLVPLGLVCLVVILGNMMVIFAVFNTHKLRGATYLFIVSLACADLMLGVVVLPFSAMYEVFSLWLFGSIWCSIWLAVDVWMCTASILHLVVISLDRYIAVTHPITYPNIMTSKRAKMLIAAAWVLSFVICFPPLVGWNDQKHSAVADQLAADKSVEDAKTDRCNPQCVLNQEPGYVIYSAVGSFYAPMLVMMFFNWRIYRTAKKTTIAIRQGWTKVKGVGGNDEEIGMGIHRGGSHASSTKKNSTVVSSNGMVGTKLSSGSTRSSSCVGNGANVTLVCKGGQNGKLANGKSPSGRPLNGASKLAKPPMPRSASCQMVNKDDPNKLKIGERLTVSSAGDKNLLTPNGSKRGRSKSVALAGRPGNNFLTVPNAYDSAVEGSSKDTDDEQNVAPTPLLRLSQHSPCPNHVGGKTFSERGTQTLTKQKSESLSDKKSRHSRLKNCLTFKFKSRPGNDEPSSSITESCDKNHRKSICDKDSSGFQSTWKSRQNEDEDIVSVGSQRGNHASSPTGCFQCHPRRWRRRTPKICSIFRFQKCRRRGKRRRNSSSIGSVKIKMDTPSLLNMSLPGSTDELRSLGGVAAMIGSVVNHTAQLAVAAGGDAAAAKQTTSRTFGRRNIKNQVRRFRMETKAAKTLGIIVGCFILCWFPFFTMYLVTAFCEHCIPPLVFSTIFWLGYCNSALNPFIYAMFSREFRGAFKKILCRLFCKKVNDQPNRRGVFMAFQGAAAAAAVVTAAGTRNAAATVNKVVSPAVYAMNSEVHSGYPSNNSLENSRQESVIN